jgi:peptidoglycan hydrolase-like protein with peptidoglycan-binding domain
VQPRSGDQSMAVTSADIKKAQEALKAKGLEPGTDGKMDAKTQQALRDFQKANDLTVTGVLDEKTAAKLGVHLGAEGKSMPGQSRGSSSSGSSSLDSSPSGSSSGSSSSSPQSGHPLR